MFDYEKFPKLALDAETLDKAQASILTHYSAKEGRENLHLLLIAELEHGVINGNSFDRLNNFMQALLGMKNVNGKLVLDWLYAYTTLRMMKREDGSTVLLSRDKEGRRTPFNMIVGIEATPFYEYDKPKAAPAVFDPIAGMESYFKRAGKLDGASLATAHFLDSMAAAYKDALAVYNTESKAPAVDNPIIGEVIEIKLAA